MENSFNENIVLKSYKDVMNISIIIAAKSREDIQIDLERIKEIALKSNIVIEIICTYGLGPARQRNEAVKKASGEWIYLIDNDSVINENFFISFEDALKKFPKAIVVGGPSVLLESEDLWQKAIQAVFSSDVGIGPIKSRYLSIGNTRKTNEKELILCNLFIKKEIFILMNGFNEELFPNEENEFLRRIIGYGDLIYSPDLTVSRKHRENISDFFFQMYSYGKGRTRHFLFSKNYNDYIYFFPLLMGLISLMLIKKPKYFLAMLVLYLIIIMPTSLIKFLNNQKLKYLALVVLAYVVCHTGYALGLLGGFFENKTRAKTEVEIEIISSTQDA
jgi:succinoglycan biosynthesis protein ExoA